jgi:hypothetical protein
VLGGSGQLRSIYSLSKVEGNGSYPYRDNDLASENKTALLAFRSWALANGAALHVVLIPPRSRALDTDYYAELRAFLRESEIDNLDLSFSFARRGLSADDLYWRDGHLNLAGNVAVADTLLKHYGEVFSKNGRPRNHGGY